MEDKIIRITRAQVRALDDSLTEEEIIQVLDNCSVDLGAEVRSVVEDREAK